ncbi:MAG TPA: hypothetical protein VJV05_08095 [Pyrinomonadaceae bacterium]|nr:hypothetical protein [Pyrinomonadaceae bacterium]
MTSRLTNSVAVIFLFAVVSAVAQTQPAHKRIEQVEVAGRRIELKTLTGAVLFVTEGLQTERAVPLIVHFHGAPWLIQYQIATHLPHAALITVQLGAGSSVYGKPFANTETFKAMIDEARVALGMKRDWSSITLTGFSAGYGAIRAILRNRDYVARVDNVLLLDGIHASYSPEGVPPVIKTSDVDSYVEFAGLAARGKKTFVIAHSAIWPGAYASTTECTSFVIDAVGLTRRMSVLETKGGMRQVSTVDAKGFHVRGYSGSTARDHVDFLHSMPEWFGLLKI